jgi:hypothetical protein
MGNYLSNTYQKITERCFECFPDIDLDSTFEQYYINLCTNTQEEALKFMQQIGTIVIEPKLKNVNNAIIYKLHDRYTDNLSLDLDIEIYFIYFMRGICENIHVLKRINLQICINESPIMDLEGLTKEAFKLTLFDKESAEDPINSLHYVKYDIEGSDKDVLIEYQEKNITEFTKEMYKFMSKKILIK